MFAAKQGQQTRRVLKQAVGLSLSVGIDDDAPGVAELSWLYGDGPGHEVHEAIKRVPCPYGQPGDRLWVRETWAYHLHAQGTLADDDGPWVYAADGDIARQYRLCDRWRPSIHMPRYACRIRLNVTAVRVERLHAISDQDAIAEGIEQMPCAVPNTRLWRNYDRTNDWTPRVCIPQNSFRSLWSSINGAESWDANPWVWVVEFRRA